jgi:hypothetical protein
LQRLKGQGSRSWRFGFEGKSRLGEEPVDEGGPVPISTSSTHRPPPARVTPTVPAAPWQTPVTLSIAPTMMTWPRLAANSASQSRQSTTSRARRWS